MKKSLKFLLAVLSFLIAAALPGFAQAELLQLKSPEDYRVNALLEATEVMGWMSTSGSSSADVRNRWAGIKNPEEILAQARMSLKLETLNTDNSVYTHIVVTNNTGDILLEGYTEKKAELVGVSWTMPRSAGDIVLRDASYFWVSTEKELSQAFIITVAANGQETWYELAVSGRRFLYARDSLGLQNAYVMVRNASDGSTSAWTITTGRKRQSVSLAVTTNPTFEGVVYLSNPTAVTHVVKTERSIGINPVFAIVKPSASVVPFDISTSEGAKRPIRFRVIRSDKTQTTVDVSPTAVHPISVSLQSGLSYVTADWAAGDIIRPTQTIPVSTGGGKGPPPEPGSN